MKIINIILILFFLLNMQKPLLSDDNDSSLVSDTLMSKNLLNKVVTDSVNNTENLQGASFTYKYLIRIFPSPVINRARLIIYGIQNTDGKDIRLKIYDLLQ